MNIARDSVVSMHYTLRDDAGDVIDTSAEREPLAYLHGYGNIVTGLERELEGKSAGDKLSVKVSPAEGYGEYEDQLVQKIPRRSLRGIANIRIGMQLHAQTPQGTRVVTVTHIAGDMITIDANHPLAGKSLNFEVEITDVRQATEEELSHGHVHGEGGHHH
jgi:FKBP-type peptidyl-prolyl cis-trans isomerase SlyD